MYDDQVILFCGGIHDWMGEFDQAPHKMGKNWYRIKNPCMFRQSVNAQGQVTESITAIQGNSNLYKRYIDVRVPEDSIIEIRTIDKTGAIYETYQKEIKREKPKLIEVPTMVGKIKLD